MKSLFTVATIIALVFFFGCSEKKKSEADIDGQSNADSDLEEDTDEVEKTDVEPDGPEIITENENEQTDAEPDEEVKDTETTDDIVTDSEPDEENDEDVVEPLPSVIYVNESAEGAEDGTSWENAFMDLQSAIDAAVEGDQIWVAAGKYKPTSVHGIITMEDVYDIDEFNRYLHFRMKNGVEIYGGFAGTETELSQRDFQAQETILSCDLGEIDEQYDNCFHIFYHPAGLDLDETAVLDGFLMEGGVADETEPHDAGSVMYNDGSSPAVKNGWIYWNYSYKGAVFYNKDSSMKVMDTQFVNNEAPYSKGGVFYNENSSIEISGCDFANSWAEGDNESNGGAIYSTGGKTVIADTIFRSNEANLGGAIFVESGDLEISGCNFEENKGEFGAAIYLKSANCVISKSDFRYNDTYSYGETDGRGAIYLIDSELKVTDSIFYKHISGWGGAIYSTSATDGGSKLTIINSAFSVNKMNEQGGALYLNKTNTDIVNSVFFKNYWGYSSTGTSGGAIYRANNGSLTVTNSIFKSNTAGTGKHIHDAAGNATVTYSCIVDTTVYPGTGNINDEPLMISPEYNPLNFGIQPESPCIDTGSNTPFDAGNIAEGITKDMSGNDRIIKGKETSPSAIVDMGAVEFKPAP
ncbi:MAG TPA: hypothetical protein PLG63_07100 [bacterium]|nr:hypothetical protein [bacterium]HPM47441.1 hypothetical protein [bacterium]